MLVYDPPRRFSYTLLSGAPVRDHVGTVELTPHDEATRVTYAVRTHAAVPVGGRAVVAVSRRAVKQLLNGIATESERRAAARA